MNFDKVVASISNLDDFASAFGEIGESLMEADTVDDQGSSRYVMGV